jgi:predicted metal-dependent hydrolase
MRHYIQFGSRKIDFTLTYLNRKSLGIKVYPDATVEVLAPVEAKEKDILVKLKLKAPWILKQIDHFNSYRPITPTRKYINGETHLYLGRQYRLKIIPDISNTVKAYRGQLLVHTSNVKKQFVEEQLQQWYKSRAEIIFNEILDRVLIKFKRYKITKPSITIRMMSKRWGSCTPSGKIILNTGLIKASKSGIEYVIIHELCHLIYHGHTKLFYNLQTKMLPDWQKLKNELEYNLA